MSQSLLLQRDERILCSWNGKLTQKIVVRTVQRRRIRRDKVRTAKKAEHESGILVLTSQRLAWMQRRGRFRSSYHLTYEILLDNLSGISMGGTMFKYVTLSDGGNTYQLNIGGIGSKEFQHFKDTIMQQREKVLSLVSSPQIIKEIIKTEVVMIPCTYCRGKMLQTQTVCPHCGAPHRI